MPQRHVCLVILALGMPGLRLAAGEKKASSDDTLVVSGRDVSFQDKTFRLPCHKDRVIDALGKPDRLVALANDILVWDNLGVFAYVRSGGTEVFGFNVALGDMRKLLKFAPKTAYRGQLVVCGAAISAKLTVAQINKDKMGDPFVMQASRYTWRAPLEGCVYFINHGTTETWSEFGPICEFAIECVKK